MSKKPIKSDTEQRGFLKWQKEESLRAAELAYITDGARRPLEYWWDYYCKETIDLPTFLSRAGREQWAVQRDKYWDDATKEILKKSKYRLVQDRIKELEDIQYLRRETLESVRPQIKNGVKIYPVAPNSMEGMIGAFVKLDQLADAKREAVLSLIEPDLVRQGAEEKGSDSKLFTPDEIQKMARDTLANRMNKRLLERGEIENVKENSTDPNQEKQLKPELSPNLGAGDESD